MLGFYFLYFSLGFTKHKVSVILAAVAGLELQILPLLPPKCFHKHVPPHYSENFLFCLYYLFNVIHTVL